MDQSVLLDSDIDECAEFCNICYNSRNNHSLCQVFHLMNVGKPELFNL